MGGELHPMEGKYDKKQAGITSQALSLYTRF